MGSQQLLLIVLGVIVVGIAVVVGFNQFNYASEEAAKDGVISDMINLGNVAQIYWKKPAYMGGGGNSYGGFTTVYMEAHGLDETPNGTYSAGIGMTESVALTGTPAYDYEWTVGAVVTPTGITFTPTW